VFDLCHGNEIENVICDDTNKDTPTAIVSISVEAEGYGAVLVTSAEVDNDFERFLETMSNLTITPLLDLSNEWKFLTQEMQDLNIQRWVTNDEYQAKRYTSSIRKVPGTDSYTFAVVGNAIEGHALHYGNDVQFPWEDSPRRIHYHNVEVSDLVVDIYPVTNILYKNFLEESGWTPEVSSQNWLRHWINGSVPNGYDKKPVVWVSHEDASAYCNFYKKRLPHSWEWQWFSQGDDSRPWPWGHEDPDETRNRSKSLSTSADVTSTAPYPSASTDMETMAVGVSLLVSSQITFSISFP
jgi:hypothetical protein